MSPLQIDLYCDDAGSGNPGPGGYAYTLIAWDTQTEKALKTLHGSGYQLAATNNQMELTAAAEGLKALSKLATRQVISDSHYLIRGMSEWDPKWQANPWRTAKHGSVENKDLWMDLLRAAQPHTIPWTWTKGHSTAKTRFSYFNNLVDEEAVKQRDIAVRLATGNAMRTDEAAQRQYALTGRLVALNGVVVERLQKRPVTGYRISFQIHAIEVGDDDNLYLLPKAEQGNR